MYGYPPWLPPPVMGGDDHQKYFEKGMHIAHKLYMREQREKERQDERKHKKQDDERKRSREARDRFFTKLEWFILGCLSFPIVGPLYHALIKSVTITP